MSLGEELQVVQVLRSDYEERTRYELDEELLKKLLLDDAVRNLPVVVVSVAGAMRGGKSFLLNFFLRYLSAPPEARNDGSWLGTGSESLVGFNWRAGEARNTTGILLWSKPFIFTLPNGEQVAVLLMDTQGIFDGSSTNRDNSTIFALSTLVSSVQIYNLTPNIQEDNLQHLLFFTKYGSMVQEKQRGVKAFQTLGFLIRDWKYPYNYAFGEEGGRKLLKDKLEISNQPQELKDIRKHIFSSFEKIFCFLMPRPGSEVENPAYNGNISVIDPKFIVHLKNFVPSLLSIEKLSPKTINNQVVKCGELFYYFKTYIDLFNSDQITSPTGILQATVQAGLLTSIDTAREVYEKGMGIDCGPSKPALSPADLQDVHKKHVAAAKKAFTDKRTMATEEEISKCLDKLTTEWEGRLPQIEQSNLSKLQTAMKQAENSYEQTVKHFSKGHPLCLHPADLDALHQDAINSGLKIYDGCVRKISQKPDQKRAELIQTFEAHLVQLRLNNDKDNIEIVKDIHMDYWKFMETKSVNPPISDQEFTAAHEEGKNQAIVKFKAMRNKPNSLPNDIYEDDLIKMIDSTFWRLQKINLQKIELENIQQEQQRLRIEQEQMKAEQARIKAEEEKRALEQDREKFKQDYLKAEQACVKAEQETRAIELERTRIEQEYRKVEQENKELEEKQKRIDQEKIAEMQAREIAAQKIYSATLEKLERLQREVDQARIDADEEKREIKRERKRIREEKIAADQARIEAEQEKKAAEKEKARALKEQKKIAKQDKKENNNNVKVQAEIPLSCPIS